METSRCRSRSLSLGQAAHMRQPKNRNGINQNAARKTTARIDHPSVGLRDGETRCVPKRVRRPFVQSKAGIEEITVNLNVANWPPPRTRPPLYMAVARTSWRVSELKTPTAGGAWHLRAARTFRFPVWRGHAFGLGAVHGRLACRFVIQAIAMRRDHRPGC